MDPANEARQALAAGDRDRAAALFERALRANPADAEALAFLMTDADRRADWAAAAAWATRLLALHPSHPAPLTIAARAARQQGDAVAARRHAEAALRSAPDYFPAMLERAEIAEAAGDAARARALRLAALGLAEAHRGGGVPLRIAEGLKRAADALNAEMGRAVDAALEPFERDHGVEALARIRGAAEIFSGQRPRGEDNPGCRPGLMFVPGLQARNWYERSEFDWVERVEAATDAVRAELLATMEDEAGFAPYINDPPGKRGSDYWAGLNRSTAWSAFHFHRHGQPFDAHRQRCPRTAALLDSLPLMRIPGYAPEAMFSVLRPGARIPPHHGSVNGRLTVHLPLIVPPDCGALRVGNEARGWNEGEVLVFDDAMEHEAWNASAHTRVVLIFDVWNPQLTPVERDAFAALLQAAQQFERGTRAP